MFQDMFGNFTSGRIGRGRFILLTLLLAASIFAFAILLGGGIGVFERLGGTADTPGVEPLAMGSLLAMGILGIAVIVGQLNLVAKRARDIGWNALLMVVLYLIFTPVVWVVLAVVGGKTS